MAYLSLYRKWRPENFSDIAGQKNIVKTLKNAIKLDRIAHAYLFCGPRGTGKTSTAKVLAKALNCETAPTTKPCEECLVCNKIKNNNSMDLIEIDAASNRGIDEIRELREKVRFSPTEGNYKIYIIDEVHMLTKEAFNALLKTLEEPPSYVIFILATTEPHKLLPTILSRCQRFDFKRLSEQDIIARLEFIAKQEEIEVDNDSLAAIARYSAGGMRDAISILDQTISFAGGKITLNDVEEVLGVVGKDTLFKLVEIIINGDVKAGIDLINNVINQGIDIKQFVNDLIYHFRNLLLFKECNDVKRLINTSKEIKRDLLQQAQKINTEVIFNLLDSLTRLESSLKNTTKPEIMIEMGIVRLIREQSNTGSNYNNLLTRLNELENKFSNVKSDDITAQNSTVQKEESTTNKVKESQTKNEKVAKKAEVVKAKQHQTESKQDKTTPKVDDAGLTLQSVKSEWEEVIGDLKSKNKMQLYSVLQHNTSLVDYTDNQIGIKLQNESSFYKDTLYKGKKTLNESIKKVFGPKLRVRYIFSEQQKEDPKKKILDDQLVKEALDLFSGKVVKIEDMN